MKKIQTLSVMNAQRMTSLEIAELTDKPHNDVLKAIRKMEPAWVKVAESNFRLGTYKDANGQLAKCYIRLRELGGDYEDEYQCALLGNIALCKFATDKAVVATLRFSTHEANGAYYQDIVATDIVPIN